MHIHDLIGIGFGPSNIALAIALDEHRQTGQAKDALFIERQPALPGTRICCWTTPICRSLS